MDTKAYLYRQEAMKRWILLFIVSLFSLFVLGTYAIAAERYYDRKQADTWAEWMIPEECTIKAEDIKAEFLKTDVFMTTADAIREDKVPTAATTTTAADIKAGFKTTTKISAKLRPLRGLIFFTFKSYKSHE